jgi:acid stress-induced BolA-like protein IbaG/YrbA
MEFAAIVKIDGEFYCAFEHLDAHSFQSVKLKMMDWMKENLEHLVTVEQITQKEWEENF